MIPVLGPPAIRKAEAHTIAAEPISSWALMERAAERCVECVLDHLSRGAFGVGEGIGFAVVAGMGNNGGDGLAVARMLHTRGFPVRVLRLHHQPEPTSDNAENCERAKQAGIRITEIFEADAVIPFASNELIIDSIFGIGLNRPAQDWVGEMIQRINASRQPVIAIDIPSGLAAEPDPAGTLGPVVRATLTLTFEVPKLAFLLPETGSFVGTWECLNIGLGDGLASSPTPYALVEEADAAALLRARDRFAHKGQYGHALLIAGSHGRMGAAVMASRALIRSGVGLATAHAPCCGVPILQATVPELMCSAASDREVISSLPDLRSFDAIGVGPGLGVSSLSSLVVKNLLRSTSSPCVIDADALNILAENPTWLAFLPVGTILTPHPKEFDRLVGSVSKSGMERLQRARELAFRDRCHVVLKGAFTAICLPNGTVRFNPTGNPGMAKGGSGDVLTGILTGLLAQGYSPTEACMLGAYAHGAAGDQAASAVGMDGMTAGDLVDRLPAAWAQLRAVQKRSSTDPLP